MNIKRVVDSVPSNPVGLNTHRNAGKKEASAKVGSKGRPVIWPNPIDYEWYDNTNYINLQSLRSKKFRFGFREGNPPANGIRGEVRVEWHAWDTPRKELYSTDPVPFDDKYPNVHTPILFEMSEDVTNQAVGKLLWHGTVVTTPEAGDVYGDGYKLHLVDDPLENFTSRFIKPSEAVGIDGILHLSLVEGDDVIVQQQIPNKAGSVAWEFHAPDGSIFSHTPVAFTGDQGGSVDLAIAKNWFEYYPNKNVVCVSKWSFDDGRMSYWSEPQTIKLMA